MALEKKVRGLFLDPVKLSDRDRREIWNLKTKPATHTEQGKLWGIKKRTRTSALREKKNKQKIINPSPIFFLIPNGGSDSVEVQNSNK